MSDAEASKDAGSDRLSYAEALNKIQFEHTLIHYRMTWLFTSQGFFLAAYFTLKSKTIDNPPWKEEYSSVISLIAMLTAFMFYLSILAAHTAMGVWRRRAEEDRRDALVSKRLIHYLGDAPASTISLIFAAFWLNAVLSDFDIYHASKVESLRWTAITAGVAAIVWLGVTLRKFRI